MDGVEKPGVLETLGFWVVGWVGWMGGLLVVGRRGGDRLGELVGWD